MGLSVRRCVQVLATVACAGAVGCSSPNEAAPNDPFGGFPSTDVGANGRRDGGMDATASGGMDASGPVMIDGGVRLPDGRVIPEGELLPDGAILLPDGGILGGDPGPGPVMYDGGVRLPDGRVIPEGELLPDGAVRLPDGGILTDEDAGGGFPTDLGDPWADGGGGGTNPEGEVCDNGLDDNGNGLIDERRVLLVPDTATPAELVSLGSQVRELAEGELPNGLDDNGNGIADEAGLWFRHDGSGTLTVSLSLERLDGRGGSIVRTLTTSVRMRND